MTKNKIPALKAKEGVGLRETADLGLIGVDKAQISGKQWEELSQKLQEAIGAYNSSQRDRGRSAGRGEVRAKLQKLIKVDSKIHSLGVSFDPATRSILHRISMQQLIKIENAFKVLKDELPSVAKEAQVCLNRIGKSGNFPDVAQLQLIRRLIDIFEAAKSTKATIRYDPKKGYYGPFVEAVSSVFKKIGIKADRDAIGNKAKRVISQRDKERKVSGESHEFHRPDCRHYNSKDQTAAFFTREEAIQAGYVPCKICKP